MAGTEIKSDSDGASDMAGTETGGDSVSKVEIENECGDGALDKTKLDSVGSGEIVTYDCAIEFFQKGGKIVECDGLGTDAEVEGVTKEEKVMKVNIVDFLAKLQINGVSQKPPVNVHMGDGEVGENAKLEERVKDKSELLIENNKFVELDDNSEAQLLHEAMQQLQTEATDDSVVKDDSESLTEKTKSAESDENLQSVKEIVDDNTECQNVVMDDDDDNDVLSTKEDEAELASEVEQQLKTEDLIVGNVSESTIEDGESVDLDAKNMNDNVEKIDDNKEAEGTNDPKVEDDSESLIENNGFVELDEKLQHLKDTTELIDDNKEIETVVMDDVQNLLSSKDYEVQPVSELEQEIETEATSDLLVNDDSESQIENSESVEFDSKLQTVEEIAEITDDDNKEAQTVVMDQNSLSLEDDEVKSVSELEQKLETEANSVLLVNDDSDSKIVNSESVEFDSKIAEIIDDNKRSQDVVVENVLNALSQEDGEAQSVNEADDEIVNESTVSQVSEISVRGNQLIESVEVMEDCPATEYVKSEHENEEACLEKDRVSQVEETQFAVKKSQNPPVIFPRSFVTPEVYIEFGFNRHEKAPNKPPDVSATEIYIVFGSFGSEKNSSEIVTPDLQEENAEMPTCQEVDEMEPECGSENNSEIVTNDLQEENAEIPSCHEVDEMEPECGSENIQSEIVSNDLQEENCEMLTCHQVDKMEPECGSENNNSEIVTNDLQEENAVMPTCPEVDEMGDIQKAEEDYLSEAVEAQTVVDEIPLDNFSVEEHKSEDEKLIEHAQLQLDEKTRCRDAISNEIQMKKESMKVQKEACEAANLEVKAAKGLVKSQGQEIDYFQRIIKKTNPIEDVDSTICELVHMIMPEKDESQVIRKMKKWNSIRDQLALNVGFDETQQALYQKDWIKEHVKRLKKELKSLKDGVLKAEVAARSIRKKYEVELEKERGLRTQLRVANEFRKEAYQHLNKLKNYPLDKATISHEENHSDDEFKEKVAGNNERIMKNEEHAEPRKEEVELKKHQLEENKNANEARTQAELQAQKESEKKEKARLKRLRQKERKRAGGDVAETQNAEEKTQQLPQPHVLLKELKRSIIPTHPVVAFANRSSKGLWKHSGKMVTAVVVLLSVISLGYTDYAKLVSSQ